MAKDMTKGNPGKTLFFFAVPMVLGNLFQQLYNIIDSILPSVCYKINCRCCFDYFCNYNFKEDILEVTYVASFYISKKM